MTRREIIKASAALIAAPALGRIPEPSVRRIPVILATDIGDDIDDTWALGMILQCPELDLKLVVTDYGKAEYRARIAAKFLQEVGHSKVPVGLGPEVRATSLQPDLNYNPQAGWIEGFTLESYKGEVHDDGVKALIDIVMKSKEPVTIIAIGPVTTVAAALAREPRIATKAKFAGMHGSVRKGYGKDAPPMKEYNVERDVASCQEVFRAAWPMVITPLDTCGLVKLEGAAYQRLLASESKIAKAILENYGAWEASLNKRTDRTVNPHNSSTLFDTAAVYLALASHELLPVEKLKIAIRDDGFMVEDAAGKEMNVALNWKDLAGFHDFLVERLSRA